MWCTNIFSLRNAPIWADPFYGNSHETICTRIVENDQSKHIIFSDQSDGKTDVTCQSHVLFLTSGSCGTRFSFLWSSRLCAVLLITWVSVFMLHMMSLWHLTVLRYILKYIYRYLHIEIQILSWDTSIITCLTDWSRTWIRVWTYERHLIPDLRGQDMSYCDDFWENRLVLCGHCTAWWLTHKCLETLGCVLSIVATDGLVLKHQAISTHSADWIQIVLDQFHTQMLH